MKRDELEVRHHTILVQRWVRTRQVHLPTVGHLVNDLVEKCADAMRCLESEFDTDEESFSRDDRINFVLAGKWTIDRLHVKEPVYIGALRSFPEDRIDDVRIDVAPAVGDGEIHKIGGFFRHLSI